MSPIRRRHRPEAWVVLLPILPLLLVTACDDDDDDDRPPLQNGFSGTLEESQEVPAPVSGTRFQVTITNEAPDSGTFQTPVWLAFHDGTFDLVDVGSAADLHFPVTNALERLAEDGEADLLVDAFDVTDAGHRQDVVQGQLGAMEGPLAPGETVSAVFELDPADPDNRYLSYASMVIPSNDAFVANVDPMAHEIFDAAGNFVATDFTVAGDDVLDAGTEVNDEVPANTAFFGQTTDDTGLDENGTVQPHLGFLAAGMGGILDDPMFAEADFLEPGYEMLSVRFEELPADEPSMGLVTAVLSGSMLDFSIAANGLSGPLTGVHFHQGDAGVAGPILIDLTPFVVEDEDGNVRVEGVVSTSPDFRALLRDGDIYVNLHTTVNPDGELRGQLETDETLIAELDTASEIPFPVTGDDVRVTVTNRAPELGTFQTPVWVGFHDGSFELHDLGYAADQFFPATNGLERLAEDGDAEDLRDAFTTMPAGDLQGVIGGQIDGPELGPGETASRTFRLDPTGAGNRYLSYASMVIPSNDAFVANDDPMEHEIFDAVGTFVGTGFIVGGDEVLDAGTEVNDEIPANTAFFGQTTDDTGTAENGLVQLHPGFLAPGTGGILDDPMFAEADFTAPGYQNLEVDVVNLGAGTPATGLMAARLDETDTMLTFSISARNLSGPVTGMHLHEGAVGVAGPIVVDLTSSILTNEGGRLFAADTVAVPADVVAALMAGEIYVNVHTALNPAGEIRGQLLFVD